HSASPNGASAKDSPEQTSESLQPLFESIRSAIPPPRGEPDDTLQLLVANLDYSEYHGRLALGRIFSGTLNRGAEVAVTKLDGTLQNTCNTKLYGFEGLDRIDLDSALAGDIV